MRENHGRKWPAINSPDEGISGLRAFMLDQRTSLEQVIEHVRKTDDAMDNIVASVEDVSEKIRNISAAAEEQSLTSEEISRAMERISEITRNLNRSILTIREQAPGLSVSASNLKEKTTWFKIDGGVDRQFHAPPPAPVDNSRDRCQRPESLLTDPQYAMTRGEGAIGLTSPLRHSRQDAVVRLPR